MKRIIFMILCLLLVGCSNEVTNFQSEIEKSIAIENNKQAFLPENNKTYYSYYVDPSVGRLYSDQTSSIFVYQSTKFIMNLNVTEIINSKYYDQDSNSIQLNEGLRLFSINGEYLDYTNNTYPYICDVFKLNKSYYLRFVSKYVTFYTQGSEMELINVVKKMLQISKTLVVNEEKVITYFSSKETIEYTKETIQLFDIIVPVNGNIQDLLDYTDSSQNSTGDDYIIEDDDDINEEDSNTESDDYQTDDYESN